jgi:hypothetical protein
LGCRRGRLVRLERRKAGAARRARPSLVGDRSVRPGKRECDANREPNWKPLRPTRSKGRRRALCTCSGADLRCASARGACSGASRTRLCRRRWSHRCAGRGRRHVGAVGRRGLVFRRAGPSSAAVHLVYKRHEMSLNAEEQERRAEALGEERSRLSRLTTMRERGCVPSP